MTRVHRSRRLVLHEKRGEDRVRHFVRSFGARQTADSRQSRTREVVWQVTPTLELYYVETERPEASVVQVVGSDAVAVEKLGREAEDALNPWGLHEATSVLETVTGVAERERAILLTGLVAPNEFHPQIFGPLAAALGEPEDWARRAAVEAIAFSVWPEFQGELRFRALTDPSGDVRNAAATLLLLGYGEEVGK
jgi:hypothetical protein